MLLSTSALSRQFSGLRAVQDVDFSLPQGQIRALIGPNGAGKTTFVSMLSGRIWPSSGQVRFLDQDVTTLPAHKRIMRGMAYTFQITSIFSNLPVLENVMLAARRKIRDRSHVEQAALAALDRVGLAGRETQVAGDLSYGHQRLLEIAMGLVQAPKLLILDEPTQGLADSEIETFKALVRDLVPETTILLIEHNMNVVMETAEIVTVMDFGQILAEGTPAEIRANPQVQAAYLGVG